MLTFFFHFENQALVISILGIRSNKRFNKMLHAFNKLPNGSSVIERLKYFKEMNFILSTVLWCYGLTLGSCGIWYH